MSFDRLDDGWLRGRQGIKWGMARPGELPAWVADMDFPLAPPVRAELDRVLADGDLGYPPWLDGTPLREVLSERLRHRYGWAPPAAEIREFCDIIQAVQVALHLGTRPGEAVALHVPAYPPFLATLATMGRPLLPIPMRRGTQGWTFDPERFDADVAASNCRALLLVNPHNPTGRSFTPAELAALAEVAHRHDLLIVSDEVHAELTYPPARHTPIACLDAATAGRTVTLTSATKAFNMAAVRCALAHVGHPELRGLIDAAPPHLFGVPNLFGVRATLAAWSSGEQWLADLLAALRRNRDLLAAAVADRLPGADLAVPEATYLAWLDLRALGLPGEPARHLREHARVWLSPGPDFGQGFSGFARLNFATSPEILTEILDRVAAAVAASVASSRVGRVGRGR